MDTDSTLPAKRLRASLNGNVQITECIREFKLPRQYPSMVPKLNDTSVDTGKRLKFQTVLVPASKAPSITTEINQNKETSLNIERTIKLKAKDGRELGKVKLRDLPQNIQGKTITIARNDVVKKPRPVSVSDRNKDIATGVLPSVSVLKTNNTTHTKVENTLLSMMTVAKNSKDHIANVSRDAVAKGSPMETKTITDTHCQARPQVLVFQSGKTWHMVKIPKNMQTKQCDNQIDKSICMAKWPKNLTNDQTSLVEVDSSKDQLCDNITSVVGSKRVSDNSAVTFNKTELNLAMQNHTDTKQLSLLWSKLPTEGSKSNILANVVSTETTKPNIEISRVSWSLNSGSESIARSDTNAPQNSSLIRQDAVIVFSESQAIDSTDGKANNHAKPAADAELTERTKPSAEPKILFQRSARRKKLFSNKNSDATKYSASRDITSTRQAVNRTLGYGEKKNEMANLSILEKALSSVEDEVLREKALKVLADCGIGIERRIPIRPPAETKSVKDSDTQTSIFGLLETEKFIHVSEDNPGIQRLQVSERSRDQSPNKVVGNPNSQELYLNHLDVPNSECVELTNMVEKYVEGCDTAAQVANIFAPPSHISYKVIDQLEKDFNTCKEYDDNGLLNIHRAVTTDNARAVQRHLMVLRCCEESADIPTGDGQTSLELAIRHEVSPEIVTLLLDAGAEPTSTDPAHDSALIIACRKTLPIMKELIARVKTPTALDNCDSTGFTGLHYCTQSGYHEGIEALINASADINSRDRRSGRTPLFHAVENEHYDIAEMLLKKGADANIANYGGYTIYNIIDETKHYNLLEFLNRPITNR